MPPILTRTERAGTRRARICGGFTYIDDWTITGRTQGVIIQKVTRSLTDVVIYSEGLEIKLDTPALLKSTFDPNGTRLNLDTMTYWELFPVAASGDIHGDQFQAGWFAKTGPPSAAGKDDGQPIATTRGVYTIHGEAQFYATTKTAAQLGFSGALAIAAGLQSTTTDPTPNLTGLVVSAPAVRTVIATWDCRKLSPAPSPDIGTGNVKGVTQLAVS